MASKITHVSFIPPQPEERRGQLIITLDDNHEDYFYVNLAAEKYERLLQEFIDINGDREPVNYVDDVYAKEYEHPDYSPLLEIRPLILRDRPDSKIDWLNPTNEPVEIPDYPPEDFDPGDGTPGDGF